MSRIKHISFDVWNTLLIPNPSFATDRTDIISEFVNEDESVNAFTIGDVESRYTRLKKKLDEDAIQGIKPKATVYNWLDLLKEFRDGYYFVYDDAEELKNEVEKSFLQYPPTILDSTKQLLKVLRTNGYTVSIGSNTNFISGKILHPYIQEQTDYIFEYALFSGLIGYSKPDRQFFEQVHYWATKECNPNIKYNEILHVGDHPICDIVGASTVGMRTMLSASPKSLYNDVINFMREENEK